HRGLLEHHLAHEHAPGRALGAPPRQIPRVVVEPVDHLDDEGGGGWSGHRHILHHHPGLAPARRAVRVCTGLTRSVGSSARVPFEARKEATVNTVLRPVGPEPARVYWTRRLLVLGALVVAATLVWTLIANGGGPGADAKAGAGSSASPAASASTEEEPAAQGSAAPCTAEALELSVLASRQSYPGGAEPSFTITVTNVGEAGCTVDVGDATRELRVTSGK